MQKATRKQVKRHNQQLVLRAVYENRADNRAALAQETHLTKPTVSSIISDMISKGFVEEVGRGESTSSGGKRPTLLSFVPTARQVLGLSLTSSEVVGCLAHLNGEFTARHIVPVTDSITVLTAMEHTINALMAQNDSQILCISVGVPGVVDETSGIIRSSPALDLYNFNLADKLSKAYRIPVYIGNNTEFATRTQMVYGTKDNTRNLTTLFVGDTIDIGSACGTTHYQHGGNISVLALATTPNSVAFLKRKNIIARAKELIEDYPDSVLARIDKLSLLDVRRGCLLNDTVACIIQEEMAEVLAQIFAWIITLMRPDELVLAGSISLMGQALIDRTIHKLSAILPEHVISGIRISMAESSHHLELRGAVVHGLHRELGIV